MKQWNIKVNQKWGRLKQIVQERKWVSSTPHGSGGNIGNRVKILYMVSTDQTKNITTLGEKKWGECVPCLEGWKMVREHEILIFYNQNSTDRSKRGGGGIRRKQYKDAT